MNTMTRRHRLSPFSRGLSALLAVLYVAVALGAARHAGEHDETGLEWLPAQFHHHHYQLVAHDEDPSPALHEICAACHWSRLGQHAADEAPMAPEAAPVLRIAASGVAPEVRDDAFLLPDSRGPPSA